MSKTASCHCGAVSIQVAAYPTEITACNCSLCRSYGVLWAYYSVADVVLPADEVLTDTYAWNGQHVDFHRCSSCGCITHWVARDRSRDRLGINARLFPVEVLTAASVRQRDGASR